MWVLKSPINQISKIMIVVATLTLLIILFWCFGRAHSKLLVIKIDEKKIIEEVDLYAASNTDKVIDRLFDAYIINYNDDVKYGISLQIKSDFVGEKTPVYTVEKNENGYFSLVAGVDELSQIVAGPTIDRDLLFAILKNLLKGKNALGENEENVTGERGSSENAD